MILEAHRVPVILIPRRLEESMREEDVLETTTQKTRFRLSTLPQYCALYSILNFDYGTALTYLMQVLIGR